LGYKYVFITGGKYDKSNTWVFLLLFGLIYKSIISNEMEHLFYVNSINNASENKLLDDIILNNNIMFIYIDDMIYSGTQTGNTLAAICKAIQKHTSKDRIKARKDIHFMAIPYITTKAKANLESIHMVEYSDISVTFSNIIECLAQYIPITDEEQDLQKYIIGLSKDALYNLFTSSQTKILPIHILVYFVHKIADDFSTITDVLNFGYYSQLKEVKLDSALVNNCNREYFKKTKSCINQYYKNITYTIGDRDIRFESLNDLDILPSDSELKPNTIQAKNSMANNSQPR